MPQDPQIEETPGIPTEYPNITAPVTGGGTTTLTTGVTYRARSATLYAQPTTITRPKQWPGC